MAGAERLELTTYGFGEFENGKSTVTKDTLR